MVEDDPDALADDMATEQPSPAGHLLVSALSDGCRCAERAATPGDNLGCGTEHGAGELRIGMNEALVLAGKDEEQTAPPVSVSDDAKKESAMLIPKQEPISPTPIPATNCEAEPNRAAADSIKAGEQGQPTGQGSRKRRSDACCAEPNNGKSTGALHLSAAGSRSPARSRPRLDVVLENATLPGNTCVDGDMAKDGSSADKHDQNFSAPLHSATPQHASEAHAEQQRGAASQICAGAKDVDLVQQSGEASQAAAMEDTLHGSHSGSEQQQRTSVEKWRKQAAAQPRSANGRFLPRALEAQLRLEQDQARQMQACNGHMSEAEALCDGKDLASFQHDASAVRGFDGASAQLESPGDAGQCCKLSGQLNSAAAAAQEGPTASHHIGRSPDAQSPSPRRSSRKPLVRQTFSNTAAGDPGLTADAADEAQASLPDGAQLEQPNGTAAAACDVQDAKAGVSNGGAGRGSKAVSGADAKLKKPRSKRASSRLRATSKPTDDSQGSPAASDARNRYKASVLGFLDGI